MNLKLLKIYYKDTQIPENTYRILLIQCKVMEQLCTKI